MYYIKTHLEVILDLCSVFFCLAFVSVNIELRFLFCMTFVKLIDTNIRLLLLHCWT